MWLRCGSMKKSKPILNLIKTKTANPVIKRICTVWNGYFSNYFSTFSFSKKVSISHLS